MSSEEERNIVKIVLCFFVPMMVVGVILHLCGVPVTYYGDPAVKRILLLGWIVYSFFSWKDKRAFFKRCALALPFALLAVVLLRIVRIAVTGLPGSSFGAVIMFMFLTKETKNLKKGFVISLVTAVIMIILLAIFIIRINNILYGIGK